METLVNNVACEKVLCFEHQTTKMTMKVNRISKKDYSIEQVEIDNRQMIEELNTVECDYTEDSEYIYKMINNDIKSRSESFIIKYGMTDDEYKKLEQLIKDNLPNVVTEIVVKNKISKGDGTRGTRKTDSDKIKELVEQGKTVDEAVEIIKDSKIKSAKANWEKKDINKFNEIVNKIVEQANNKFGYVEK